MTAREQRLLGGMLTLDRLVWGMHDFARLLVRTGWWPSSTVVAVDPAGNYWRVLGDRASIEGGNAQATAVLIPEKQCLWGSFVFPAMRRSALGRAVKEAVAIRSPLSLSQVSYAWTAIPTPEGGWSVKFGVCKLATIESIPGPSTRSKHSKVYLQSGECVLPVANVEARKAGAFSAWKLYAQLIVAVVLLVCLVSPSLVPLALKRQAVVQAMETVANLEPKTIALRSDLEQVRKQTLTANELSEALGKATPYTEVLNDLSSVLPNDSWLDRLELNGDEVRMIGVTTNATDLVAAMTRSGKFLNVRATTPSVRDGGLNKERFTFECKWNGGGAR